MATTKKPATQEPTDHRDISPELAADILSESDAWTISPDVTQRLEHIGKGSQWHPGMGSRDPRRR